MHLRTAHQTAGHFDFQTCANATEIVRPSCREICLIWMANSLLFFFFFARFLVHGVSDPFFAVLENQHIVVKGLCSDNCFRLILS